MSVVRLRPIARKSEAAKVTPKIIRLEVKGRTEHDRKEVWCEYEMAQLKTKIWWATGNPPPAGWCDIFRDDYLPPPGDEWPDWSKKVR